MRVNMVCHLCWIIASTCGPRRCSKTILTCFRNIVKITDLNIYGLRIIISQTSKVQERNFLSCYQHNKSLTNSNAFMGRDECVNFLALICGLDIVLFSPRLNADIIYVKQSHIVRKLWLLTTTQMCISWLYHLLILLNN